MLHQNAIPSVTLDLLKKITALKQLESFGLGGGTSLSLRIGHRRLILIFLQIHHSIPLFYFSLLLRSFRLLSYCFKKIKR